MTISKWVHVILAAAALIAFFVYDRLLKQIWTFFNQTLVDYTLLGSYVTLTTVIALALAIATWFFLYKRPGTFSYLGEIVAELQKVTWPSWEETKRSTLVVIVFTVLLSAYLAGMDWIWKIVTDFIITPGA